MIGDIGTGFFFDLRLPQSTYQGQYLQEGCGGFCGFLSPSLPLVADDCPAVTGNTLALAVDNEGHVTRTNTDARWAANDAKSRSIFGSTSEHQLAVVAKTLISCLLRPRSCLLLLRRVLRWRARGAHRGPALSAGLQRNPRRGAGQPPDGANRRGFELEHSGQHRTWGPRDSHLRAAPGAPRSGGTGMWPGAGIRHAILVPAISPRRASSATSESPIPALRPRRFGSSHRSTAAPPTGLDNPSIRAASPTVRSLGGQPGLSNHSGDRDWPQDTSAYQFAINLLRYMAYGSDPPSSYSLSEFHFTLSGYKKLTALSELYDAKDPDLSSFAADGGRLIVYQGWADEVIPPFGTVAYYEAMVDSAGGYEASQAFSRLYMIPAQYHCLAGGDPALAGANLLTPLIDWVQHGTPPGTLSFDLASPKSARNASASEGVDVGGAVRSTDVTPCRIERPQRQLQLGRLVRHKRVRLTAAPSIRRSSTAHSLRPSCLGPLPSTRSVRIAMVERGGRMVCRGRVLPSPERGGDCSLAHVHARAPPPALGECLSYGRALRRRRFLLRRSLPAHKPSSAPSKCPCHRLLPRGLRIRNASCDARHPRRYRI